MQVKHPSLDNKKAENEFLGSVFGEAGRIHFFLVGLFSKAQEKLTYPRKIIKPTFFKIDLTTITKCGIIIGKSHDLIREKVRSWFFHG